VVGFLKEVTRNHGLQPHSCESSISKPKHMLHQLMQMQDILLEDEEANEQPFEKNVIHHGAKWVEETQKIAALSMVVTHCNVQNQKMDLKRLGNQESDPLSLV